MARFPCNSTAALRAQPQPMSDNTSGNRSPGNYALMAGYQGNPGIAPANWRPSLGTKTTTEALELVFTMWRRTR